jgi:hypothetical protein
MSAYIKLSTLAYPRHIGDVEFDPAGMTDYALVEWRDPPEFDRATQRCGELAPVQEDGVWHMVWAVRDATQQEIDYVNNQNRINYENNVGSPNL